MAAGNSRQFPELREETIYIDGNTVRRVQEEPQRSTVSESTRKNRARSLMMNQPYVIFLTVAALITVLVCVNYVQLLSRSITLQKEGTALETRLSSLRLANDVEYNRILSSVNLEDVKNRAMNEFGMIYAGAGQVVTYDAPESDYVKQYTEVQDGS